MRDESTFRKKDEKIESLNNKFLEKNFYNKTEKYIRNTNKRLQILGIDSIFIKDGIQFNCDEKVAAQYINKNLMTFAFELSFIDKNGDVRDGWFLDDSKLNDCYILCWLDKAKTDNPETIEDVIESEIILIYKKDIINYLNDINWNTKKLKIKTKKIRCENDLNFGSLNKNGIKFSFSEKLVEKPINLIISREVLRRISLNNLIIKQ